MDKWYYDILKDCGHEPDVVAIRLPIRRPGVYDYADDSQLTDYYWMFFTG